MVGISDPSKHRSTADIDLADLSLTATPARSGRTLLLWPADAPDMVDIAGQLGHFGYRPVLCDGLASLLAHHQDMAPIGIIVDCDAVATLSPQALGALQQLGSKVPIAALSSAKNIDRRLMAVRMGWQAFFTRPLDVTGLLDTLERITAGFQAEAGKVLIVDDSPAMTALYAATLAEAGFVCREVTDPMKTLEVMEEFSPELVLLDMHMPGATGEELAKVIRQEDAYLSTPIVFLSAETDVTRQREAMSHGGDEFLQKPIEPQHLISAVRSRIARYRALRALMVRDSLTGLLNHTSFKERLRNELARMKRQHKTLALAIIDIDFFKQVNDGYGHQAGDRVIKSLARLLKQRMRYVDLIGRYGGEEFAVAMPDTFVGDARIILDQTRQAFSSIVHIAGERTFRSTLSAGLAQMTAGSETEELINLSDTALYRAKNSGRDRVEVLQ